MWCEQQLTTILAGAPDLVPTHPDPVVTLLAGGPREEVARRRDRLARAVADFDAATIATTHGFCQEVLAELGTIGDLDRETEFVEDVSDLLEETLDDLYVRRFGPRTGGTARFTRAEALQIARAAVFNPTAQLEPSGEPDDSTAAMRYRLAVRVRRELEQRKRALAIMTYDDLLTRLRDILGGPNAAAAKERLRARYGVVLVDEFQDTDPIQWQILSRAFASAGVTLVLVADPKQAIYAFRGAEVYAYLVAAAQAHDHATLAVNRRSDQPLLDAFDALFADARLGHEGIVYRQLRAAPAHQTSRLRGAPEGAALRIRVVHRSDPTIEQTNYGYARAPSARKHVARDLAADVVRLLGSGATLEHRSPDGEPIGEEVICPRHVAVLVRTHANAELVCDELTAARVPAVINGAGSVFATATARDWLRLLEALERPASTVRARTAARRRFSAGAASGSPLPRRPTGRKSTGACTAGAGSCRDRGVAALASRSRSARTWPRACSPTPTGERQLTDLRHLGAAAAPRGERRAPRRDRAPGLARRANRRRRARGRRGRADAPTRVRRRGGAGADHPPQQGTRVSRSSTARSCGSRATSRAIPSRCSSTTRRRDSGARSTWGSTGGLRDAHVRQHRDEQRGEDLRLAYVALTRAKHQAVIWWAASYDSRHSPLGRLLFAKGADGTIAPEGRATPSDEVADQRFAELAARRRAAISVERSTLGMPTTWSPPREAPIELAAARFDRQLDLWWRRTSYSDITVGRPRRPRDAASRSARSLTDEPVVADAGDRIERGPRRGDAVSSRARIAAGGDAGRRRVRHLRALACSRRPTSPCRDLDAELAAHVAMSGTRRVVDLGDPSALVAGLAGGHRDAARRRSCDGLRLRDVSRRRPPRRARVRAPAGGRRRAERAPHAVGHRARAAGAACRPSDPMAAYATRLEDPALRARVRGFLTGSIDLVIRLGPTARGSRSSTTRPTGSGPATSR